MEIIEIGRRESAFIISLKGRMDVICAPEFEKSMDQWMRNGETHFIIDFSEIDFISSAGLRSILITAKKLEAQGGKLLLSGPKDTVKRVFEISGFHMLIPISQSVDEALEKL